MPVPASIPARTPTQAEPVNQLPATAAKAPTSMKPSSPTLKTPAFAQIAPPRAASSTGVSARRIDGMIEASISSARTLMPCPSGCAAAVAATAAARITITVACRIELSSRGTSVSRSIPKPPTCSAAKKTPAATAPSGFARASRAASRPVQV